MALAAVMWATSGTFTVLAIDAGVEVMQVTVFTTVITAIILVPLIATFDRKSLVIKAKDFLPFLAFSIITGTFFTIAWFMCVDMTSVATAVILLYAYPSIVTVASIFLLKERLSPQKALALPLTFVGAVLVAGAQEFEEGLSFDLVGIALGIYAAFGAAVYYIWGKKFLGKYSANTVILYMTMLSIPGLVIIANPFELLENAISTEGWLYIIALSLFPGTIGFVVSMVALNHIEASKASIVASIEPVAAVVIAFVILLEAVNGLQIIGVVLVFAGVILLRMSWSRKGAGTTPEDIPVILEK